MGLREPVPPKRSHDDTIPHSTRQLGAEMLGGRVHSADHVVRGMVVRWREVTGLNVAESNHRVTENTEEDTK